MKRYWLLFSQAVTVLLAAYFIVATLQPGWLRHGSTMSRAGIALLEAPSEPRTEFVPGSLAAAAQKAMPAVVSINTSKEVRSPHLNDPWFHFFFGDQIGTQQQTGLGSGVIVSPDGYILTNNHVVEGADQITVTLADSRIAEARIVGTDPETDLAVLKIELDKLPVIVLGNSDHAVVGDTVLAIGNPFGVGQTVTSGIISALGRSELGINTFENFIQTDAAINPGNSGGPLFDASGRVIGITSSIATLSQESGSIGLGFAIPVNVVKNVAAQLVDDGQAEHAFLGVTLSDGTASADGVTRRGAVVESVTDGSPAAKAGLRTGDVVVAVDKDPVGGAESLTAFVRSLAAGDDVTLTVVRDGKAVELDVTLATRPDNADQQGQGQQGQGQQGQGQQGQGQQGQGQQGQQGQGGDSTMPGGVSPDQLWEWLQQQRG